MADQATQLGVFTTIVADTGEVERIKKLKPVDATTNPSLLLKVVQLEEYADVVREAVTEAKGNVDDNSQVVAEAMDRLAVAFGVEILAVVPGVVSTEIDARLSFDTESTLARARRVIQLYADKGIDKKRVLIKLASTWEGLRAAEILEKEGIHCNMTLLFSKCQAIEAAHVGATLISPFVGRITDWHKKAHGVQHYEVDEDPGVQSVRDIYAYYKTFKHDTIIMGASFRSKAQVLALAGCDKLTISPALLAELAASTDPVSRILDPKMTAEGLVELSFTESSFRFAMNEDQCATEKLAEGIRKFSADTRKLEDVIRGIVA